MISFLLYTIIFWVAGICFVHVMRYSIQDGQWFDTLFDWQNRLNAWSQSPSKRMQGLAKIGGDCGMCFSHFLTLLNFIGYAVFMNLVVHKWPTHQLTTNSVALWWAEAVIVNLIWYVLFMCIGSIASFLIVYTKHKLKKGD